MNQYMLGEELNDNLIVADLKKATSLYEDGAIIESASMLQEILNAVNDWIDEN